ncbi:hypothetical protein [Aquimarina algiphila]|uniref:Uncharacterized protein n=1 Tax=Aquimarina algiphila TaxID=2047982 RepID=A0A554VRN3_9FLAO|nr:hypothetical protein [Aquimarina algiphila]TSE11324.1 hypothetical protein FOF46_01455 [Aquimarina algiphila]
MSKWFYPAQKEISKEINKNSRFVNQVIAKNDVFEKYIIQENNEMYCMLYQIKKDEYNEKGYKILRFRGL